MALLVSLGLASCGGGGGGGGAGSGSGSDGNNSDDWLIPVSQVVDGGPGRDGIPAIDNPLFVPLGDVAMGRRELVVGIKSGDEVMALPHRILNWHEIVNVTLDSEPAILSYCPLTGSAMLWQGDVNAANPTFGVSGLLFNSNLILFDRASDSLWSQMMAQSVWGEKSSNVPRQLQVIETTWQTWQDMYPDSLVLSETTGFSRDYQSYPYGDYLTSTRLLFDVSSFDNRLHRKERVIGINENDINKVYVIDDFTLDIEVINDDLNGLPVVVVSSSRDNIAAIYKRTLADGTILEFSAVPGGALPLAMQDNEGNEWDIFGNALSGTRVTEQLARTSSFTAFWFAWVAFFAEPEIHAFD
ncbi:MAG: DUF3179 domain-containing protein [Pseudomonadales bacterium]|jgi:hypothetical protein|nr:DUF3179 domain-containing protein [Pseudomonadales bacterium]MDP7357530.1 DUF3179 domain-containing protein [Pseudomonadales bacterium]MDP7597871.1 DUF3179 domain-containing protein [Pseudomonadales bacterium]HJN51107.1 DUF3179 domain-containing protein [Pseudomonadales bacterium]|tara:strand:- start:1962 stop:3029 length:1068 start_codon:yes stop_codon:yes gene_type:complete